MRVHKRKTNEVSNLWPSNIGVPGGSSGKCRCQKKNPTKSRLPKRKKLRGILKFTLEITPIKNQSPKTYAQ